MQLVTKIISVTLNTSKIAQNWMDPI